MHIMNIGFPKWIIYKKKKNNIILLIYFKYKINDKFII